MFDNGFIFLFPIDLLKSTLMMRKVILNYYMAEITDSSDPFTRAVIDQSVDVRSMQKALLTIYVCYSMPYGIITYVDSPVVNAYVVLFAGIPS